MEERYFLGTSELMAEDTRIAFPPIVERLGIVTPEADVLWAYDRQEEAIAVSQDQDSFEADERYDILEASQLGRGHVSAYPVRILDEYEHWERGDHVCFVATEAEVQNNIVRIVPEDQLEEQISSLFNAE